MKPFIARYFFLFLLILVALSKGQSQNFLYSEFKDLDGNYVTINDQKGEKFTVIDFWATWCKPCLKSIPEMIKISNEYSDQGVKFIGVNEDSPRNQNKVRPFANSLGIEYPVILDPDQEIMTELVVSVFPTFIILDNQGKVIFTHEGYLQGDEDIIRKKIEQLLADAD